LVGSGEKEGRVRDLGSRSIVDPPKAGRPAPLT